MADSSKALLPVYLFIGDDNLKRDALLTRMKQRVGELGDIELNLSTFEAVAVESPDVVVAACNTMPFLSEKRLVVVKDIDLAKGNALSKALAEYIASPMESTILVITGGELKKSTALYKSADKHFPKAIIPCDSKKKRGEVVELARKMMATIGINMEYDAASRLVDLAGTSTVALDAEVRKLRDYVLAQGRTFVTVQDIDAMVTKTQEPKPWDITDALSRRDARACLKLYSELKDPTPYGTMTLCIKRIRELIVVKSLHHRPGGGTITDVLGGKDWMYRNHEKYAAGFTEDELITALDQAAECDRRMKTGADPEVIFPLWLVGVCTGHYAY